MDELKNNEANYEGGRKEIMNTENPIKNYVRNIQSWNKE